MEIWKDIKGYEGVYQISTLGRIKCLSRKVLSKKRKTGNNERTISEYIRTPETTKMGYQRITLSLSGKNVRFSVHRLVSIEFIPNPDNKPCVNHKNGIKWDNNIQNLEWVTYSENERHSYDVLKKNAKKKQLFNKI